MKSFKKIYETNYLNPVHCSIHGKTEHFDISEAIATNDEINANRETAARLTQHYSDLLGDKIAQTHIKHYTENSEKMNSYLWNKHKNAPYHYTTKALVSQTKKLNEILHSYKSPEDLTIWSSSIHDPEKLKNKEGIVHHPAFISTSTYRHVALNRDIINAVDDYNLNQHHHIFKIHVPKGSPGAYVDHISKFPGEFEYVLPSGMNLKHIKTTTTDIPSKHYLSPVPTKNYTHIHEMELQND